MNQFQWAKAYFQNEDRRLLKSRSTMAALMTYADFDTLECWPSQTTLARVTGVSVSTVHRHLKLNVKLGWLVVVRKGKSKEFPNKYRLSVPTPSTTAASSSGDSKPLAAMTGKPLAEMTDRTTHRTTKEPLKAAALNGAATGDYLPSTDETNHVPTPSSTARGSAVNGARVEAEQKLFHALPALASKLDHTVTGLDRETHKLFMRDVLAGGLIYHDTDSGMVYKVGG